MRPASLRELMSEDAPVYDKHTIEDMLDMIADGNKTSGGLTKLASAVGVVGFVRFLDCFYITLITQRKQVGTIGSNAIYSIKAVETFPIKPKAIIEENAMKRMWNKLNRRLSQAPRDSAESKYLNLFQFVDLTKDFFFSYTYDLTNSLQYNYAQGMMRQDGEGVTLPPTQEMYEWNKYQTEAWQSLLVPHSAGLWILPLIHGSFQQRHFSTFGKSLDVILLARRSRYFAGTRYLKRGTSVHGKTANDCEVEQILQSDEGVRQKYASYLQMRGSIPTYWHQETSVTVPKPPILVNRIDPSYLATQEHFADLMLRYGGPIIVLDLVKQNERRKRECLIGAEFKEAVNVINETIPLDTQIRYCALDFSR